MVKLFRADTPLRLAEIKNALQRNEPTALEKAAHTLKGSVGNFAAQQAFTIAKQLEFAGKDKDLTAASTLIPVLEAELLRVDKQLEQLTGRQPARPRKRRRR